MNNARSTNYWVEEAISKKIIKYYEYENFNNIEEIGIGNFGRVFRANCKNTQHYLALKSFFNFNEFTLEKIVCELKRQTDVNVHHNIIRFYGITKLNSENEIDQSKNYLLVMEYADGGNLRNYLKKNFEGLTWNDKWNLAYQLTCAISFLHDDDIVHSDLHSCNILVHQNSIKLADFSLSKEIEVVSKSHTKSFSMIPYIEPKKFNILSYSLNKKSDVYSVGVLLWEISSGKPPFEDESDVNLAVRILQGLREKIIPNTSIDYEKLYTECWDGEPDNRPSVNEVVKRLKTIIYQQNENIDNITYQISNENSTSLNEESLINNYTSINSTVDEDLCEMVNDILMKICEITNEGKEQPYLFLNYLSNFDINAEEIRNKILNNQNNPNFIFLLGYFSYLGIGTIKNEEKAFRLFINASEQDHLLAQYYVGKCYEFGIGTVKDEKLAFKYLEKFINRDYSTGQLKIIQCYDRETDIKKDFRIAFHWYEEVARNGSVIAMCNLGLLYLNGNGIDKDYQKAFELFRKSADGECLGGIVMLGYCYYYGIGTKVNFRNAFKLFKESASLGHNIAQCNLAFMYEIGKGVKKNINQAMYWYEKSAEQGNLIATSQLDKLRKIMKRKENSSCKII